MSTGADYRTDEWVIVTRAPDYVGNYIIFADLGVTTLQKELKGLATAIEGTEPPADASALVSQIVEQFKHREAELHGEEEARAEAEAADAALGPDHQAGILQQLTLAMAIVRAKGGDAEAAAFGSWLMMLAQATAEAAKEGGVLGIGSVRVSDKEKAALVALQDVLGGTAG